MRSSDLRSSWAEAHGRPLPDREGRRGLRSTSMPTVLIVDDEPDILLFVRINLELAGYDVREAGDGDEPLPPLRQQPPDVLVLDGMWPKVAGWSVPMKRSERSRVGNGCVKMGRPR